MWRWAQGAQEHLPFNDMISNIYGKLDRQWQTYLTEKRSMGGPYTTQNIIRWIEI